MPYDNLLYEARNGVAYITLNRPEQMNALSEAVMADLDGAVEEADLDDDVRCLVVKGNGRSFCAGYDLGQPPADPGKEKYEPPREEGPAWGSLHTSMYWLRRNGDWWLKLLWNLKKPVIAQVHGYCLAGGNDLAGMCDLIVAAEDAQFGMPQQRGMGIVHTAYGLMPFTVGLRKTKELAFSGDTISGREAERIGLVNKAVPASELDEEVTRRAERIALVPIEVLMASKWCINRVYETMGVEAMIRSSNEWDAIAVQNPVNAMFAKIASEEGIRAALTFRDGPWNDYVSGSGRKPVA